MSVAICGTETAELYAAFRLRRTRPDLDIENFQQSPEGTTFGLRESASAVRRSVAWYENCDRHRDLNPYEFAFSHMFRAGRSNPDRLVRTSPNVTGQLAARGVSIGEPV